MRGAARLGDLACGGVIVLGSPNVYVDNRPVATVASPHTCGLHAPAAVVTGSSTVYANGLPVARIGDIVGCGGVILTGSTDVFVA